MIEIYTEPASYVVVVETLALGQGWIAQFAPLFDAYRAHDMAESRGA